MSEVYKVLQPEKYLREYISRDFRPDGRKFDSFRWVAINPGPIKTADGSCIAKLGHTKVVCGIKAELTTPCPECPGEGFVVTNVELPPLCSSQFRPGPPGTMAQACNQLVADIFNDSQVIDLTDLCIAKDKLVWVLYCDIVCIEYDGSVVDACLMALITALKTLRLPAVEYNAATGMCVVDEDTRKEINVQKIPVATTFTLFESNTMLVDPTSDEERLCGGPLGGTTVVRGVNCDDEGKKASPELLRGVHRNGGAPLSTATLQRAVALATKRAKEIQDLIFTALNH